MRLFLVAGCFSWMTTSRIRRGQVLVFKELAFVEAGGDPAGIRAGHAKVIVFTTPSLRFRMASGIGITIARNAYQQISN